MGNRIPGVYLSEVSKASNSLSKNYNLTVILGTATNGPLEPTIVYSKSHAINLFGNELADDFGLTALQLIADEAEQVMYVRVAHKGDRAKFQKDETDVFEAKEGGTHLIGHTVTATANAEASTVTIVLKSGEVIEEQITCSTNQLSEDYIVNVFNNRCVNLNLVAGADFDFSTLDGDLVLVEGVQGAEQAKAVSEGKIKILAKHPGTYLNGATARVLTTLDGKIGLNIVKNSVVIESIPLGAANETADAFKERVNMLSSYVIVEEVKAIEPMAVVFAGGNAGLNVDDSDYIDALNKIADPSQFQITTLIIPGISNAAVLAKAQLVANARQDFLFIADPPIGLKAYQTVNWVDAIGIFTGSTKLATSYVAVYSPWVRANNAAGKAMFLPPSIAVALQMVRNDKSYNLWDACAGVQRGVLQTVNGLEHQYTNDDVYILYKNSVVNPIIHIKDRGYVIWGNKTCKRPTTAISNDPVCSVNVRRLVNFLKYIVRNIAMEFVFELNDSTTWDLFKLKVEPRFRAIQEARGMYAFEVVMDETTVTPDHIDALEMPGIIRLQPTRAAEEIIISFELYPAGVEFEDHEKVDE